jgi:hypothetical protein
MSICNLLRLSIFNRNTKPKNNQLENNMANEHEDGVQNPIEELGSAETSPGFIDINELTAGEDALNSSDAVTSPLQASSISDETEASPPTLEGDEG